VHPCYINWYVVIMWTCCCREVFLFDRRYAARVYWSSKIYIQDYISGIIGELSPFLRLPSLMIDVIGYPVYLEQVRHRLLSLCVTGLILFFVECTVEVTPCAWPHNYHNCSWHVLQLRDVFGHSTLEWCCYSKPFDSIWILYLLTTLVIGSSLLWEMMLWLRVSVI